jgi:tetratricopeptide (TPR) repeat protein/predicted Ser/Thr protein kinase
MIGTVLNNRYQVKAELGRGGMGVVYRAHDTLLERDVAVKLLSRQALGSEGRARLLHEARATAKLNHPNIVSVYDAGEVDGAPFIVMELVEGASLHERRPEGLHEILAIARQVCAALEHAHAYGVIHRDIKPENVALTPDGTAKLMDFGLARSVASRLTVEGTIIGTVFYLAPELALGQAVDGRADLYALGVMLYELTTGRLPFTADDPVAVISQHLHAPVVPPRAKNAAIPPDLDALIVRLLSKEPGDRPGSATEVLGMLDAPDTLDKEAAPAQELSLLERIERGRLIGRKRELQAARAQWKQALAGQRQVLLISGEPGVGKSRLVRELVTQAQVSGGRALMGASYAEGGVPYAPFAQILNQALAGDSDAELDLPEFVLADLLTLAPALRLRYPQVKPNPPLDDPRAEQHRLMENVAIFVTALSEVAPLLLVLEDAHWADSATLALLRHLARRTRQRRVMLIATYREVELDAALPLHETLLDLRRERLATQLELTRLDRDTTGDLLRVLFDEEITPDFLEGIYRETEGNPFFVEEVCKALAESGELTYQDGRWHRPSVAELGIPHSVQVAIQSRLRALPDDVQETLRLAAFLGREFDLELLEEASQLGEEPLLEALERAERAQLIAEVSGEADERFAFVHGLIASTLVESTRSLKRRRLHRRVAAAIEVRRPDDGAQWEALAYHWDRAGEKKKASGYMLKAGQRAARQYANQEALAYLRQALERADADEEVDRILRHRARVLLDLYRGQEAAGDYERLLERARDAGDASAELDALLGLARASYILSLDAHDLDLASRSRELYQAAHTLARELGDKRRMVQAILPTVWFLDYWPEYLPETAAKVKEASALSRELGDEELMIDCMLAMCRVDYAGWAEQGEELLKRLVSRHDLVRLNYAYFLLMWSHLLRGNLERCIVCSDAGIDLAAEMGALPVQYPTLKALALLGLGRYDAAWEALQSEVADEAHPFASAFRDMGTGMYLAALLAYERASGVFEELIERAQRLGRAWMSEWARMEFVRSRVEAGPQDRGVWDRLTQELTGLKTTFLLAPRGEPARIQAEIALGQGRWREALAQAELACTQAEESGCMLDYVAAVEVRLRALLELDRAEDVVPMAEGTIQVAQERGYRPLIWRMRAAKAQALEMLGDVEAAAGEYQTAAALIRELADNIPDMELRRGFMSNTRVSSIMTAAGGN